MPYYRGDFYGAGRGDPGWFRNILGAAASFIPVVGPAVGRVIAGGGAAATAGMATSSVSIARRAGQITGQAGRAISQHPVLSAAGAAGAITAGAAMMRGAGPGVAGAKGFHMSKPHKCSCVAGGAPHMVRNRHMRVTNPRALRRSLRRVAGFARVARRVLRFTHPRAARGRAHFRFAKKRRAA